MWLNFGLKKFSLNILKTNYLLPQPDRPTTTMKTLSFVEIFLFIVLDLVEASQKKT